ncbi:MAG: hypothetical protein LBS34_00105 [Rickettsiales bacterium]|jgi:hypothetical protein|nr:hypothetical protein [Rickettsiales bacterium]
MSEIGSVLQSKKVVVDDSIDRLLGTIQGIIVQKNNKILSLNGEINRLNEEGQRKSKVSSVIIPKNMVSASVNELLVIKKNNKLLRRLVKKELKLNELKQITVKSQIKGDEIDTINIKEMAAFKLIATELEEKEKVIENNKIIIKNKDDENQEYGKKLKELYSRMEELSRENKKLTDSNGLQLSTIETLTTEMQNKNRKIAELKAYFLEILDDYNDILQQVEQQE